MTTKLAAEFLGTFWLVLRRCGSAALVAEIVMTSMFLLVIHGTTHRRAPVGFAGLAIGLCLTLIHPISYPSHQHLGEPGTQHRTCALRRRLGGPAAVALLDCAGSRARCSPAWSSARSSSPTCRSRRSRDGKSTSSVQEPHDLRTRSHAGQSSHGPDATHIH